MKKIMNFLEAIIIILILIILIQCSELVLAKCEIRDCINAIKAFYTLPNNYIDVMILGSSHAWRGVNSLEMYEKYGIGAYNYATNWQSFSTEALFFYDCLETQSPKVVLLETFRINVLFRDVDLNGEILFIRPIKNSPYKKEYLKQAFGDKKNRYFNYYFPLRLFHSDWNNLDINKFSYITEGYNCSKDAYKSTMGYCDVSKSPKKVELNVSDSFYQLEMSKEAVVLLDRIVKTCKEKDIQLILFTVPWQGENNYSDFLTEYARKNDIDYIDLFSKTKEMNLDVNNDFEDEGHLCNSGAIKVADYLGDFISQKFDLPDRRLEENNLWENKFGNKVRY